MELATRSKEPKPALTEADLLKQRQQIACRIDSGSSDAKIARDLQVNRRTVSAVRKRLRAAKESGTVVDLSGRRRGSKPKLSTLWLNQLRDKIRRHHPQGLSKLNGQSWTPALVAKLANKGIRGDSVSEATMRRYMTKWNAKKVEFGSDHGQAQRSSRKAAAGALAYELLAWTLDDVATVSRLAKAIGLLPCFARESFGALGSKATIYRRISDTPILRRTPDVRDTLTAMSKVLNSRFRRKLRKELIDSSDATAPDSGPFDGPGVWSVRLVPVEYLSPAVLGHLQRAKAARDKTRTSANPAAYVDEVIEVSQRRVLAMAYDLRNGGYLMELLHARERDKFRETAKDLKQFLNRLSNDLRKRGGTLHLPKPGSRKDCKLRHQKLQNAAAELGIQSVFDMPALFEGMTMPCLHINYLNVEMTPVCRNNEYEVPYCGDGQEPFAPQSANKSLFFR